MHEAKMLIPTKANGLDEAEAALIPKPWPSRQTGSQDIIP
jgi:hypothetical protein